VTPKEELLRILRPSSAVHYPNKLHGDTIEYKGAEYQLVGKELSISQVESWVETHDLDEFLFLDHGSPDRNGRAGVFIGDRNALTTMHHSMAFQKSLTGGRCTPTHGRQALANFCWFSNRTAENEAWRPSASWSLRSSGDSGSGRLVRGAPRPWFLVLGNRRLSDLAA